MAGGLKADRADVKPKHSCIALRGGRAEQVQAGGGMTRLHVVVASPRQGRC